MRLQDALFEVDARYCLDTNVVVSFHGGDDEVYGSGAFAGQWGTFERLINEGVIVAPRQVRSELEKWAERLEDVGTWLARRHGMFREPSTEQLSWVKRIVNAYPAYARDLNYLGDLMVISLAGAEGLTVVTLERVGTTPSRARPKIPSACAEFGIECVTVPLFLQREQSRGEHFGFSAPSTPGEEPSVSAAPWGVLDG